MNDLKRTQLNTLLEILKSGELSSGIQYLEQFLQTIDSESHDANKSRIMVLEDEIAILELMTDYLSSFHFDVLGCQSIKSGLKWINDIQKNQKLIDFAVVDLMLKDELGYDIIPPLLKAFPDVKIILSSGHASEVRLVGTTEVPQVMGVLQKPYSLHTLKNYLNV
jgi:DNA-binding response OmpR family regulator